MSVKIKICGLTHPADAVAVVEAGADFVGLMFYEKSPRHIPLAVAAEIARHLPPHVGRVGVFVNPSVDLVLRAMGECGLTGLQFHGDEPPAFCTQFGLLSIKAFRIRDAESLQGLSQYPTDAWLLDAHVPGQPGGTGATFNWALALEAKQFGRPIFLAGGLNPENVAVAIRKVQPFAVDVSSGVETAPGRKDPAKVRAFIEAVRGAPTSARITA